MLHGYLTWTTMQNLPAHLPVHIHVSPAIAAHLPRRRAQGPTTARGGGAYGARRATMPVAVAAALEAMDAWHPEDFAAAVTGDAVLDDGAGAELHGRPELRDWCARACADPRLKMRLTGDRTHADVTRVGAQVLPPSRDTAPHEATLTFTVEDGLIAHLRVEGWSPPATSPATATGSRTHR
jgi:hypothetical protein